jgi:hypothetical protein
VLSQRFERSEKKAADEAKRVHPLSEAKRGWRRLLKRPLLSALNDYTDEPGAAVFRQGQTVRSSRRDGGPAGFPSQAACVRAGRPRMVATRLQSRRDAHPPGQERDARDPPSAWRRAARPAQAPAQERGVEQDHTCLGALAPRGQSPFHASTISGRRYGLGCHIWLLNCNTSWLLR